MMLDEYDNATIPASNIGVIAVGDTLKGWEFDALNIDGGAMLEQICYPLIFRI